MNSSEPWFKQFWPWFVIALPTVAVVASILTLIIAIRNADSLVEDDYYKEGMAINTNIRREKLAQELGLSFNFSINQTSKRIEVELSSPQGEISPDMLQLKLIHPINGALDQEFPLQYNADTGLYSQAYSSVLDIDWLIELQPLYLNTSDNADRNWKLRSKRSALDKRGA